MFQNGLHGDKPHRHKRGKPHMSSNRYNTWYKIGNNGLFFLAEHTPNLEECRLVLLKIIEQAKRDLINYADATLSVKREIWEEARQFLFDDDYLIMWGDQEMSLQHIGQILGLEVQWMREKLVKEIIRISKRRKKYAEEESGDTSSEQSEGRKRRTKTPHSRRKTKCGPSRHSKHRKGFRQGFNLSP